MTVEPVRILVVCTANICRSPMAAALLSRTLSTSGIAHEVSSAGVRARLGDPVDPRTADVMREFGLDLTGHRAQPLERAALAGADLVLGLTREHVREAAVCEPAALERSFTVKELVRRADQCGPRADPANLRTWLANLGEPRTLSELVGRSPADDVGDPYGGPVAAIRATAAELSDLVRRAVALLWPLERSV